MKVVKKKKIYMLTVSLTGSSDQDNEDQEHKEQFVKL